MKLTVQGKAIIHSLGRVEGQYPVIEAREIGKYVLVLYDYMSFPDQEPARNLFAYDRNGQLLWRSVHIGSGAADAYTNILSEEPLIVGNFSGFNCTIDIRTGEVTTKSFTK
jgi:hypothetical protein